MQSQSEIWSSIKQYATSLGHWGWVVIACGILGETVAVTLFFVALGQAPMPSGAGPWVWLILSLIVAALVVIPFWAFHSERLTHVSQLRKLTEEKDRSDELWKERLDKIEKEKKDAIAECGDKLSRTQVELFRVQEECGRLRDSFDFRRGLSVELRGEHYPEGDAAQFRLQVTNSHPYRTIDGVRIRVLSLECLDNSDKRHRLPLNKPSLAITDSGRPPSQAFETECNIAPRDNRLFDFVLVHSGRRANHALSYGDCRVWHPQPQHLHAPNWERVYDGVLGAGMYRVAIEVQGKDVHSVQKEYVFWGDKRGPRCVDADDAAVRDAHPLSFAPADLETLPPNMYPHQLEALTRELAKPKYDQMLPTAVFWAINDDVHHLCGLSNSRFVTADKVDTVKASKVERVVIVTEEYLSQFPSRIPGFPNAIRRSDFDLAWLAARGNRGT